MWIERQRLTKVKKLSVTVPINNAIGLDAGKECVLSGTAFLITHVRKTTVDMLLTLLCFCCVDLM